MGGMFGRFVGNRQFKHAPRNRTLTKLRDNVLARESERRMRAQALLNPKQVPSDEKPEDADE
jgi:hypothetical protein